MHMFDLKNYLGKDEPWARIIAVTASTVQSKYQNMSQATPGQRLFGYDMILNTLFTLTGKILAQINII